MTKRYFYFLAFILVFFAISYAYDVYIHQSTQANRYAGQMSEYLQQQEREVTQIFENTAFLTRQMTANGSSENLLKEEDFERLKELFNKTYTVVVFQQDSLLFWSNNNILPDQSDLREASRERTSKFAKLKNGDYHIILQKYLDKDIGEYTACGLIPLKYEYKLESNYLSNHFVADSDIPKELELTKTEGPYPVSNLQGETVCYLSAPKNVISKGQMQISLWLYLLGFLLLAIFFNNIAKQIISAGKPLQGAAFLILSIFGVRLISMFFDFSGNFSELLIFSKDFNTGMSNSLGDLLINIVLLLWVMVFFHRELPVRSYDHLSHRIKFGVTTLNYLSILIAIFLLTGVFKSLVFNTGLSFDFDNVFNLDRHSLLAITGVILLLIALFLFSHRMMLTISKIGLSRNQRLSGLGLATLISLPVFLAVNFIISPLYLALIAFVFILIFDLFIDSPAINFTWLLIWLVVLSAFPSILLFRYSAYKDHMVRNNLAKELVDTKDQSAEQAFAELKDELLKSEELKAVIPPYPFKLKENKLRPFIDNLFSENNYLHYNYTYTVHGFDQYNQPAIEEQEEVWDIFDVKFEAASPTSAEGLRFWTNDRGRSTYLMNVDLALDNSSQSKLELVFEFQRKKREASKVYTELLIDRPYKELKDLSKYEYAVYKNNRKIDGEGNVYGDLLTIEDLPQRAQFKEVVVGNRSELIYKSEEDIVVIIGKQKEEYIQKAISLFSYIFSLLILFVLLFALINSFTKILPDSLKFYLVRKPSLRSRIQLSVIGLIITSFIFIGVATVWFFSSSSNDYHENRLERKTSAIQADAMHEIALLLEQGESTQDLEAIDLANLDISKPLSKIHRMDVNMYDLSGNLVSSSETDIFNKGIVSDRMGALAFNALTRQKLPEYVEEHERIGGLEYKAAYIPLKVKGKSIAFLGLPYYSKQSKLKSDVTVFMSTLLNVYVFLLLIAGGLAIAVANSITRPIAVIGEKLKQFKLGKRNEPLEWKNKDELGALISEYNKMIKKLEESAEKLAQSEREGAWREMAKQVAHEIKNPLTPMKLSIQYLQHAFNSNPDNIEPLLSRVSSTLIEQIDNLAQIASEFSNFAKMPRAENQKININSLVTSVYDLFNEGVDMDISLNLPLEEFYVYGDKNHLIRVLNNLMKNAEQAIPDGRKGKINVSLYRKENVATIEVKDNGSGIPEDKRQKVFVPNFTTKSSGTGLGLAISKNIIESVSGEIYFKTKEGEGTEFYVELPIVEVIEHERIKEEVI